MGIARNKLSRLLSHKSQLGHTPLKTHCGGWNEDSWIACKHCHFYHIIELSNWSPLGRGSGSFLGNDHLFKSSLFSSGPRLPLPVLPLGCVRQLAAGCPPRFLQRWESSHKTDICGAIPTLKSSTEAYRSTFEYIWSFGPSKPHTVYLKIEKHILPLSSPRSIDTCHHTCRKQWFSNMRL